MFISGCFLSLFLFLFFFFFNDTSTTEIYTLSLHDALPISLPANERAMASVFWVQEKFALTIASQLENLPVRDRKSTRLNSSHLGISYAVFCLKKKKKKKYKKQTTKYII